MGEGVARCAVAAAGEAEDAAARPAFAERIGGATSSQQQKLRLQQQMLRWQQHDQQVRDCYRATSQLTF